MADVNPLVAALRRRFHSVDEALVTLGIDPYILDQKENQQMIDFDALPKDIRDARFLMRTRSGKRIHLALDEGGEEQDKIERLLSYFRQKMHPDDFAELKELFAPYMADAGAEDEPPAFPGRPRPGGEIDPPAGTDWRDRRGRDQLFGPRGEGTTEASGDPEPYSGSEDRRRAHDRAARALDRQLALDARARGIPDVATAFNITHFRGPY